MNQLLSLVLLLSVLFSGHLGNTNSKKVSNSPNSNIIGDFVWHDINGNGIQDAGEEGIEGVEVTLFDINDNQIGSTITTDENGHYSFENVVQGSYYLKFDATVVNPGYKETAVDQGNDDWLDSDVDGSQNGTTANFYVYDGEDNQGMDAGYFLTATIGDFVWEDVDGDGIQNFDDEGILGVEISLTGVNGTGESINMGPVISDNNGFYEFTNLDPGTYTLHFDIGASGMDALTFQGSGLPDDSDPDPETGDVEDIVISSGEINNDIDAGFYRYPVVGDYVWEDLNKNGIQDQDEPGMEGIEVTLDILFSYTTYVTTTDENGHYIFDKSLQLRPSESQLHFEKPDEYVFTIINAGPDSLDSDVIPGSGVTYFFSLYSGQEDLTYDAGMYGEVKISGETWLDFDYDGIQETNEAPMTGVYVVLHRASDDSVVADTYSNEDGKYEFSGNPDIYPDDYYIEFENLENYIFTLQDQGDEDKDSDVNPETGFTPVFTLNQNEVVTDVDAGYYFSPYNDCDDNPAGECIDAPVFCDLEELNDYCATMTEQWEQIQIPGCGVGYAFHNPSWVAFVANAEEMSLTIHTGDCVAGGVQLGIQWGIYDDCDFNNPIALQCPCVPLGEIPVNLTGLTVGKTYYFFIDGCNATQCTFWLEVTSSTDAPEISGPQSISCDSLPDCDSIYAGSDVDFTMNGISNATDYTWIVYDSEDINGTEYHTEIPTKTIHFDSTGTYVICGFGSNDCYTGDTLCITVEVLDHECNLDSINFSLENNVCFYDCNGMIDITGINNGIPPYNYNWSNGDSTSVIDSLCNGIYIVTITDAFSCSIIDTFVISSPSLLHVDAYANGETKYNAKNGTAGANPSGGMPPYKFLWSTGDTTKDIDSLAPGIYTVTLSDSFQCVDVDTVKVDAFVCAQMTVNSVINNASCFGECDGTVNIESVDNATSPLAYHWNTGVDSQFIDSLCAGIYIVTVTDSFDCVVVDTFTVGQPDDIVIYVDTVINISGSNLGAILITANDKGNYIYSWAGPDGFSKNKEDIILLDDPGCYTLTVTDTITNCSKDSTICIEDLTDIYQLGNAGFDVKIFPNPASDILYLDFNENMNDIRIRIVDISGKEYKILTEKVSGKMLKINVENMISGLYLLEIMNQDKIIYKKVIIEE